MPGRIITLQRQARELGRLRTGYTDTSGKSARPVKSLTWVITSHAEDYVQGAAQAWGGQAEKWQPLGGGAAQWRVITEATALDAILPPGDPLSQSYELWSGGGCARRCDGTTETLSDSPCLCRAQFGDEFYEQRKGTVCSPTSRLNVFLPEMPDVGVWRCETHSFYAASEIAGAVDLIRSAVGPDAIIPIRLRIEQRQRKAGGQTKNFPVIVVELRGITTGQVLGASVMGGHELAAQAQREALAATNRGAPSPAASAAVTAPTAAAALPSGTSGGSKPRMSPDEEQLILDQIRDAADLGALRAMWTGIVAAFFVPKDGPVPTAMQQRAAELAQTPSAAVQAAHAAPEPANPQDDPDELWSRILRTVPEDWTTEQVEREFANHTGTPVEQAGATDMTAYLTHLTNGANA